MVYTVALSDRLKGRLAALALVDGVVRPYDLADYVRGVLNEYCDRAEVQAEKERLELKE